MTKQLDKAVAAVERRGILLVFPFQNRPDPPSLWGELHPRREMRWAWDEGSDPRVAELWHLREALARSQRVVYGKWWKNRATLFSRPVFRALLADLRARFDLFADLGRDARGLLEILDDDSPRSTKALRKASGLPDARFQAELKALWSRLLIVGVGEVDDGSFPSLAVGTTRLLFEDEWAAAARGASREDKEALERAFAGSPGFTRELTRVTAALVAAEAEDAPPTKEARGKRAPRAGEKARFSDVIEGPLARPRR